MIVRLFPCPVNQTANIFITGNQAAIFRELENDVNLFLSDVYVL